MNRRIGTKHRTHDVRSELLFALETTEKAPTASQDYISQLPDECLARILNLLGSGDRKTASLVSKHMFRVEGRSRRRLTLRASRPDLLPSLLSRFDAATELVLRCHRNFIVDADDTLVLIGKHCGDRVKELVLVGVNVTCIGIESVAWYFKKLERLTLRGSSETRIGDEEISCVAAKCVKLKKLCIKGCSVTDEVIKAFALGCPNLVEIEVKRCRGVTCEVLHWLRARRKSLVVNLDVGEVGADGLHSSGGDGGGDGGRQENGVDIPPKVMSRRQVSDGWPPIFRSRFWDFEFHRFFQHQSDRERESWVRRRIWCTQRTTMKINHPRTATTTEGSPLTNNHDERGRRTNWTTRDWYPTATTKDWTKKKEKRGGKGLASYQIGREEEGEEGSDNKKDGKAGGEMYGDVQR